MISYHIWKSTIYDIYDNTFISVVIYSYDMMMFITSRSMVLKQRRRDRSPRKSGGRALNKRSHA